MLIVITGPDGSGKTSITNSLSDCFIADGNKVKLIFTGNLKQSKNPRKLEKYLSPEIKGLAVSIIRLQKALSAKIYSELGYVVISDRWPSKTIGKIDGPRRYSGARKFLSGVEKCIYFFIPTPDVKVFLNVDIETAIHRNSGRHKANKETTEEIIDRYQQFDPDAIRARCEVSFNNNNSLGKSYRKLYNNIKKL